MKATRQEVLDSAPPHFLRDDPASLRDFRKMVLAYYRDHGRGPLSLGGHGIPTVFSSLRSCSSRLRWSG